MHKQLFNFVAQINHRLAALQRRAHWPSAWGRGRRLLAGLALALCLGVPALAVVQGAFSDVPPSAFYYNAVEAIYRAGITAGCGAGLYCPDQAVTRGQMAAFLHRGLPQVAYGDSNYLEVSWNATERAVVTINTGGVPGQTGFVKLDAAVTAHDSYLNCPCEVQFYITRDGGGESRVHASSVYHSYESGAVSWVVAVPSGTTQTFRLQMRTGSVGTRVAARGELTALYVPFGSTPYVF